MTVIILSVLLAVSFVFGLFMTILFVLTEKQYGKYFIEVENQLRESEEESIETVSGLRDLLRLLRDFKIHSLGITKKFDLVNQPDFIHFQKQIASLCYIIEKILSNEGGDFDDAENNVPEERRKIN